MSSSHSLFWLWVQQKLWWGVDMSQVGKCVLFSKVSQNKSQSVFVYWISWKWWKSFKNVFTVFFFSFFFKDWLHVYISVLSPFLQSTQQQQLWTKTVRYLHCFHTESIQWLPAFKCPQYFSSLKHKQPTKLSISADVNTNIYILTTKLCSLCSNPNMYSTKKTRQIVIT